MCDRIGHKRGVKKIETFIKNYFDFLWFVLMMADAGKGIYYLCAGEFLWAGIRLGFFITMFLLTYKWAIEEKQKQLQAKRTLMLNKYIKLVKAAKKATGRGRKNETFN